MSCTGHDVKIPIKFDLCVRNGGIILKNNKSLVGYKNITYICCR